ncbi:MAG TPA: hypothetical protein ENH87_01115 [Pricia antarctica]|uniref:Uncharacterized protein n=1 Tax=Pricia antarctica TaxID=641691 RepID=A0A831VTH4_9FLAO|nr:hypothetical protein [Pricia antarctica]
MQYPQKFGRCLSILANHFIDFGEDRLTNFIDLPRHLVFDLKGKVKCFEQVCQIHQYVEVFKKKIHNKLKEKGKNDKYKGRVDESIAD